MAEASPPSAKAEQAKSHSCTSCTASMTSNLAQGVVPQGPVLFNANIGYNIAHNQPSITPPDESTIVSSGQAARPRVNPRRV
ncbi:hypothetical protein BDR03DRAFT_1017100 [Suillus americanus]|nr:hypothetical protein BDR03DRAFT_1017100 [Suillus americanus]